MFFFHFGAREYRRILPFSIIEKVDMFLTIKYEPRGPFAAGPDFYMGLKMYKLMASNHKSNIFTLIL